MIRHDFSFCWSLSFSYRFLCRNLRPAKSGAFFLPAIMAK
nr:MAG TPA: hypothetical protein [Caudoviricetes sp.]